MKINQLRARLSRLEQFFGVETAENMGVDPAIEEARRLDQVRLCDLLRKRNAPDQYGGPLTDEETQEVESLQQKPRVNLYGRLQGKGKWHGKDQWRQFFSFHILGPTGQIRERFFDLDEKAFFKECSTAEQEELELLRATYGVSPKDDHDYRMRFGYRRKKALWDEEVRQREEERMRERRARTEKQRF